jgi:molybdopterin-containing oxidoreductase family membrane subunit
MIKKNIDKIILLFIAIAFIIWIIQVNTGLILTNMRNPFSWGLYISALAFFVGNAAGGLVLSSLIYVFGVNKLKPFAKLGALCAFANVVAAMTIVIPDIGRPIKLFNLLLHPNFYSPLIWDIIALFTYACFTLIYLIILMIPDLKGPLYKEKCEKFAKNIAPFSLVLAISIHIVTAWIFATQGSRDWWHTSILAPDFITLAIASGIALILLISTISFGNKVDYIPSLKLMSKFIIITFFIHLFLMYNDFIIKLWYGSYDEVNAIKITVRNNFILHLLEIVLPLTSVFMLFYSNKFFKKSVVIISCVFFMTGVLIHRYLLMPGAFNNVPMTIDISGLQHVKWSTPISIGEFNYLSDVFTTHYIYYPSFVEIIIFSGVLLFMAYIIIIGIKKFPILDIKKC